MEETMNIEQANQIRDAVLDNARELEKLSDSLLQSREGQKILQTLLTDGDYSIHALSDRLERGAFRLAMVGGQSSGKSFLSDTLLGIPVLPVASRVTSSAKLRVVYGKRCKIVVYAYRKEDNKIREDEACTINCEEIDAEMLARLKAYICMCYRVLDLENIWYFLPADIQPGEIAPHMLQIDPGTSWQVAFLWLTLLAAYVNQNAVPDYLGRQCELVLAERGELYRSLGLDPDMDYAITLYLDNPFLANGIALLDLPGTGSIVEKRNNSLGHTEIVLHALNEADAVLLAFTKDLRDDEISQTLDSLLKCAQFKYQGSRENRIIPIITKVDQFRGRGCDQQLRNTKHDIVANILKPHQIELVEDDIHCVSALNAEYLFCSNADVPCERCKLVADLRECRDLEEMRSLYETASYIPQFSDFLRDYAVRGRIMTSAELFGQCIAYARKCIDLLQNRLQTRIISYEHFDTDSQVIISQLKNISNKAFADTFDQLESIFKKYSVHLEKVGEKLRLAIHDTVRVTLQNEIESAKDDLHTAACALPHNIFGDVVLYREQKDGTKLYETAYYTLERMLKKFKNTSYSQTQSKLLAALTLAASQIEQILREMDDNIVQTYQNLNTCFSRLMKETQTRMVDTQLDLKNPFVLTVVEQCQKIIAENADIKDKISFANSTRDLMDQFRSQTIAVIGGMISALQKQSAEIMERYKTTGVFRTRTGVLYYSAFCNSINDEIRPAVQTSDVCNHLIGVVTPLITDFITSLQISKGKPAQEPSMIMQTESNAMYETLLEVRGGRKTSILQALNDDEKMLMRFFKDADDLSFAVRVLFNEIADDSLVSLIKQYITGSLATDETALQRTIKEAYRIIQETQNLILTE